MKKEKESMEPSGITVPCAHQRTPPQCGTGLSIELPDQRQATLWRATGIMVVVRLASAHGSPVLSAQCLSTEASERLARFFCLYPSIVPYQALAAPPPRTRQARLRLYERIGVLRNKLQGSGLQIVPVTGEGYLLAASSVSPPPDKRLQHSLVGEDTGITLAPAVGLLLAWQQGVLQAVQRYPLFQMKLLTQIFAAYPHYCPYERLYAAKEQIPYDPIVISRMLERLSRQKCLHPIHRALAPTRRDLRDLGLHLQMHRDLGYQLQLVGEEQVWGQPA